MNYRLVEVDRLFSTQPRIKGRYEARIGQVTALKRGYIVFIAMDGSEVIIHEPTFMEYVNVALSMTNLVGVILILNVK